MQLLHLDSSILGPSSVSRALSAGIVARLTAVEPKATVVYRDLAAEPVPHLSGSYLVAAQNFTREHSTELQADLAIGGAILREFWRRIRSLSASHSTISEFPAS